MLGNGGAASGSYGDLLTTSLVVLGVVCVGAYACVKLVGALVQRLGGGVRRTQLMQVVARIPLEPRRSLYVVEVAGKALLVGTSEMGLSVLSELDRAEVQAAVTAQPSFAELVGAAWRRRGGGAGLAGRGPGDGDGAVGVTSSARQDGVAAGVARVADGGRDGGRDGHRAGAPAEPPAA